MQLDDECRSRITEITAGAYATQFYLRFRSRSKTYSNYLVIKNDTTRLFITLKLNHATYQAALRGKEKIELIVFTTYNLCPCKCN